MLAFGRLSTIIFFPVSILAYDPLFGSLDNGGICDQCLDAIYNGCGGMYSSGFAVCICATAGQDLESCENLCEQESNSYSPDIASKWAGFCS